jgi:ribosomal protein S18 acetylase RimI-like enzyme
VKNSLTDRGNPLEAPDVKIRVNTHLTRPPSVNLLNRYARLYMSGFNQAPWDIYGYNYTEERAREEFTRLVFTVLSSGGSLISLAYRGRPAGFSVATSLGIFIRELGKAAEYPGLPPNYKHPGQYFETLSQLLKVPQNEFENIGYIADIVVDVKFRGKGYGKILLIASLKYLNDKGKKSTLAWTVNPVMSDLLSQAGFKRIDGIGSRGEGLDFTIHNGVWYPTLVQPVKRTTTEVEKPVIAQHYLKIHSQEMANQE